MAHVTKFTKHTRLVDRMANTLGIDLDEAILRGHVTPELAQDAVYTCVGCSKPDACEAWVNDHESGSETAPEFCRNNSLFSLLSKGLA